MPVVKSGVTQREATLKARGRLAGYGSSGAGNWPDEALDPARGQNLRSLLPG